MLLIDSHCHLDASEFDADRDVVVERARAVGVAVQVIPAVTRANFTAVEATCRRYPGCLPAWGMHPMYIEVHRPEHLAELRHQVEIWRPVAIGEIGLDRFVTGLDYATQETFYVEQLKIARDHDLPVLLHCRRANDEILKQLRRVFGKSGARGGIAHAFSGSRQQAEAFLKLGFKLGFGGAFTWSRASNLRALAFELPLEAIVLETDSPDIPPAWIGRGRNEPAELARIAATLAELRGLDVATIAARTTANAREVLGLAEPS